MTMSALADETSSASNRDGCDVVESSTSSSFCKITSCSSSSHQDVHHQGLAERDESNAREPRISQSATSGMSNDQLLTSRTTGNHVKLVGQLVDEHTRCTHYHTKKDIVALKFKCCETYWPCYQCHLEISTCHPTQRYASGELESQNMFVILCGECYSELTFDEYSKSNYRCIHCKSEFNPGCSLHYDLYFDLE